MAFDLYALIDQLEREGGLLRIKEELDPKWEVAGVFRQLGQGGKAVTAVVERVKGYKIPVVGNLLCSRRNIAFMLGSDEENFLDEYERRLEKRIPPVMVKEAPVKDIVIRNGIDILKVIPVLTHSERDAGPYITLGVLSIKDPDTGETTLGVHRMQVKGPNKLGVYISRTSPTAGAIIKKAEERGQTLEVYVALGAEPSILLTANTVTFGAPITDKLGLAGSLGDKAIELVKGEVVGMNVPANAMFILEGIIPPGVREVEGPFGESSGFYLTYNNPIIEIKAITHRRKPIYPVVQPFTMDSNLFYRLTWGRRLLKMLKPILPFLREIAPNFLTCSLIMSIKKENKWDGRLALYTALNLMSTVKYAVVVDDDIDIWNNEEVNWALAGRCQPDEDMVLITGVSAYNLDPSRKEDDTTAKLGLDATKPLEKPERFEKIGLPKDVEEKVTQIIRKYLRI